MVSAARRQRSATRRAAGSRSSPPYRRSRGTDPRDPVEGEESRATEPLEGKMQGTSSPESVSTRLQRIAELARKAPEMVFTTLAHHIDLELLHEAYEKTRKDGAPGIDGQTATEYAANLEENLRSLLDRFKSGTYRAPPVRRVYIPKA